MTCGYGTGGEDDVINVRGLCLRAMNPSRPDVMYDVDTRIWRDRRPSQFDPEQSASILESGH